MNCANCGNNANKNIAFNVLKSAGLEGKQSKNYNTCGLVLRFSGVWKLTIHKLVVFSILIGTELENSITKLHSKHEEKHNF